MTRRYQSAVRGERASRTRAALLDACEELLHELPVEEVTLPAVARRAGVSKPTAYKNFADNDALFAGFLDHLRGRIGMEHAALTAIPPDGLPGAARANFARFEANANLVRRIMDSPSYERVRLSRKVDRPGLALPTWRGVAPGRGLRRNLGPVYLLLSPPSWRWLRDTWGLSPDEAAAAAAWAIETLAAALTRDGEAPRAVRRAKEQST